MLGGYIFCTLIGVLTAVVASKHVHFYRKDYTYVEDYDAFYKLHWDASGYSWSAAFKACDDEGAKLFYPRAEEWMVVKNLTAAMTVEPNVTDIFVGLHDEFNIGDFISVDGNPTDSPLNAEDPGEIPTRCVLMDYQSGIFKIDECYRFEPVPFVCKKIDEESCQTIDRGYKYVKEIQKCYKVNHKQKTWQAAMQTCYMEGGVLAILDKSDNIRNLINTNQNYYIGYRKMFDSSSFYTVRGKIFENDYFKSWYNPRDYLNYNCGIINYDPYNNRDKFEAEVCEKELPFICEIAVNHHSK